VEGPRASQSASKPATKLVVSLNRATPEDFERARHFFARHPNRHVIIWSESPAVQGFPAQRKEVGLHVGVQGKGRA